MLQDEGHGWMSSQYVKAKFLMVSITIWLTGPDWRLYSHLKDYDLVRRHTFWFFYFIFKGILRAQLQTQLWRLISWDTRRHWNVGLSQPSFSNTRARNRIPGHLLKGFESVITRIKYMLILLFGYLKTFKKFLSFNILGMTDMDV